jgi:hypothetical protein
MKRILLFLNFVIGIIFVTGLEGSLTGNPRPGYTTYDNPDTLDNQVLYNGRLWRNLYTRVKGDPFLFTDAFLPGTVTIGDKTFKKVDIKYDIYNDELIALSEKGMILQLNKEVIEAFSYNWHDRIYQFRKMGSDTLKNPNGFVNVLVDGYVSLFVKYKKDILYLAVDNRYDLFNQTHRIYVMKDGETYFVNSKKELLGLLNSRKQEIRSFINSKDLKVSKNNPDSFRSVIEYYNDLQKK